MTDAEFFGLIVNIVVPTAAAIVAAVVSVIVAKSQINGDRQIFLAQIESNAQVERDREDAKNINKLTNFAWLIGNIVKYGRKQNEDYVKVVEEINANKLGQHPLISRASSDIARILQINQEDIFFALIAKAMDTPENRVRVGRVFSKIDYTQAIIDGVKFQFEGYHITIHQIISDYRQHLENIRESISDILYDSRKNNPTSFSKDPLFIYLNDVLGRYNLDMPSGAGVDWHHHKFLRPTLEYLVKHFLYDDRVQKILTESRRASILAGRIIHESNSISGLLKQYSDAFGKVLEELNTEGQFIEAVLATT
jgi:hypothetical protein